MLSGGWAGDLDRPGKCATMVHAVPGGILVQAATRQILRAVARTNKCHLPRHQLTRFPMGETCACNWIVWYRLEAVTRSVHLGGQP